MSSTLQSKGPGPPARGLAAKGNGIVGISRIEGINNRNAWVQAPTLRVPRARPVGCVLCTHADPAATGNTDIPRPVPARRDACQKGRKVLYRKAGTNPKFECSKHVAAS